MVTTADRRISKKLAQIPSIGSLLGVFVSQAGPLATVRVGPGAETIQIPYVGQYPATPGDAVQVERRSGRLVVIGPTSPKSAQGRVTVPGTPKTTVVAGGVTYDLPYDPNIWPSAPALNDDVSIDWFYPGGRISGKLSTTPVFVAPEPPPPPAPKSFRQTFTATDSGSYGSRWFTGDVYASDSNTGAWFRGSKIPDTIPDNARITSARIYLPARQQIGAAPLLQLHSSQSQPGGPVSFVGSPHALGDRAGWVDVPLAFIDYLKANPGDIGFNHGGYSIWRGVQTDSLSGALDIAWTV